MKNNVKVKSTSAMNIGLSLYGIEDLTRSIIKDSFDSKKVENVYKCEQILISCYEKLLQLKNIKIGE